MKNKLLQNEFYELKELVEDKLFQIFLKEFKKLSITDEVYCLNICYGSEELVPPLFAFGESKDKREWLKDNVENIDSYLWNIAEYSDEDKEFTIEDEKTKELFQRYNELASKLELWDVQKETILIASQKLQNHLAEFDWNMSNDFVIAVTDLEQVDVSKNFKFLNDNSCNRR